MHLSLREFESIQELKDVLDDVANAACGICDPYDYHGNYRIYEAFKNMSEHWLEAAIEAKILKGQDAEE